jgi:hypothetical protein
VKLPETRPGTNLDDGIGNAGTHPFFTTDLKQTGEPVAWHYAVLFRPLCSVYGAGRRGADFTLGHILLLATSENYPLLKHSGRTRLNTSFLEKHSGTT